MTQPAGSGAPAKRGLSGRAIGGIIIAVLVVILIALNRGDATVSFIFFRVPVWVGLAITAAGGFIAGFLIGRKRYKP